MHCNVRAVIVTWDVQQVQTHLEADASSKLGSQDNLCSLLFDHAFTGSIITLWYF
jgi:hypothetical protein